MKIEPGTHVSKYDTLLSELTWYYSRDLLFYLLFMHHFTFWTKNIHLESIEDDY